LGLESMLAVSNQQKDVFQTELFLPLILKIEELSNKKYQEFKKEFRIIADHLKSAVFIANEGIEPSNLERGYVLRRLIRKAVRLARKLEINNLAPIASSVFEIYSLKNKEKILEEIKKEEERFSKALQLGLKEFEKLKDQLNGEIAFKLYETYGFPLEMTQELAKEAGIKIDRKEFFKAFKKHQQVSRAGVKRFKSGLAGYSEKEKKLHTATHLLLASLRKILSEKIVQKGSNITPQRLRFDFNWPERLTEEQIKKVEDLVSLKIKENLPVTMQEMSLKQAKKTKALGVFDKRYGARVKVYTIGNIKNPFSKEICAGPHIKRTGEIGKFKIIKEESVGAGIRRIKAILE